MLDLHQIGRTLPAQPAADAYPRQALGDELQLAVLAGGVVDADQGAVLRQLVGIEAVGIAGLLLHVEQRQAMVVGLGHQLQGFGPGLFVDDDGQYLRREEGAVVNGDDVQLVGKILAG